ncbi:MAG: HD domain-containing protein [bacterium]
MASDPYRERGSAMLAPGVGGVDGVSWDGPLLGRGDSGRDAPGASGEPGATEPGARGGGAAEPTAGGDDEIAAGYWRRILANLRRRYPDVDLSHVERARRDGERLHAGQTRKSGEPYFHHPLRIALEATELGLDPDTVAIALLHDALEDTEVTLVELRRDFGEIADVVDGLTKITAEEAKGWERGKAQTYSKMLVSTVRDIRTLLVKILDRLDNVRSLAAMRRDKQRRIAQETLDVYVPVAARLGLGEICRELSRHSFRYLYPKRFSRMQREIESLRAEREDAVRALADEISSALVRAHIDATVLPNWRDATDYIHSGKIVEDVHRGFTVLSAERVQVYASLGVVHEMFRAVPGRIRDFISNPRPNGYKAVVTRVNRQGQILEVELTTREMHVTNERGVLANWSDGPGKVSEYYLRYLQLLETLTEDDDLRMADVLSHALPDSIQVFSPKGDTFTFPRRASCLDFAYRIHSTKVGDRAFSATVNGRRMPISTALSDGDVVDIQTARDVRPTEQWLDWTVTARAQSAIRRSLKRQRRDRSREVGWDLFRLEVQRDALVATEVIATPAFQDALRAHKLDLDEFLIEVGFRNIDTLKFLEEAKLVPAGRAERNRRAQGSLLSRILFRRASIDRPGFTIRDFNDAFIRLAGCCTPVLGEDVLGYLTTGNGISLHLRRCPSLARLDPIGQVSIEWEPSALPARLKLDLLVENQVGLIHRIAKVIADQDVNIDELKMDVAGEKGQLKLVVGTNAPKTIQRIAELLRGVKGVQRVSQGT